MFNDIPLLTELPIKYIIIILALVFSYTLIVKLFQRTRHGKNIKTAKKILKKLRTFSGNTKQRSSLNI